MLNNKKHQIAILATRTIKKIELSKMMKHLRRIPRNHSEAAFKSLR